MSDLWMGISLLIILALVFIFIPYVFTLRRGDLSDEVARQNTNVNIYKAQLADLEKDKAAGRLSDEDYDSLSAEIKRNLLLDTEQQDQVTNHEGGKWVMPISALILVVSSIALYAELGAENEVEIASLLKRSMQQNYTKADAIELLERLNVQIESTPKDVEMWYMIGRINFDLGRYDDAVVGFTGVLQHLNPEAEQDKAVALAQLAQAQFFANGRKLDKATASLLNDALAINPKDNTALGLLGVAAYESGEYLNAVRYWQTLMGLLPPNNPGAQAIANGIATAKAKLSKTELATLEAEMEAKIKSRIKITVDVANSLKELLPKNADLFVLAKAQQGPPMPLAVQRLTVSNWPVTVMLDDSMAMMDALRLSEFENVVITARISKSGVGNAKAGDLQGLSAVIKSTAKSTKVMINQEIK